MPRQPDPRPLRSANLGRVQALFTDVDGTLTTAALLESRTLRALEELRAAQIPVVLVSGRPSGWGECWMRTLPVDGVIVENGGLCYVRKQGHLQKVYAQPEAERLASRAQLQRDVAQVVASVPGARLSSDSQFTEVDLAIDYNEDARLGSAAAGRIEEALRARGAQAVRSSVHVNCWRGSFDKLSTVKLFCRRELGFALRTTDDRICYVGDSFNDAPLFGGIPLSVGVANVRAALPSIAAPPAFITNGSEGDGFQELARQLIRACRRAGVSSAGARTASRKGRRSS